MKVIIAGSRDYHNYETVCQAIANSNFPIDVILSGGASGVDELGAKYALENDIPLETYPALWHEHGKAAGPIRNRKMAENADALIAIWDGQSKGTKNMIETAMHYNLVIHVLRLDFLPEHQPNKDVDLALFFEPETPKGLHGWKTEFKTCTLEEAEEFSKKRNYHYTNKE